MFIIYLFSILLPTSIVGFDGWEEMELTMNCVVDDNGIESPMLIGTLIIQRSNPNGGWEDEKTFDLQDYQNGTIRHTLDVDNINSYRVLFIKSDSDGDSYLGGESKFDSMNLTATIELKKQRTDSPEIYIIPTMFVESSSHNGNRLPWHPANPQTTQVPFAEQLLSSNWTWMGPSQITPSAVSSVQGTNTSYSKPVAGGIPYVAQHPSMLWSVASHGYTTNPTTLHSYPEMIWANDQSRAGISVGCNRCNVPIAMNPPIHYSGYDPFIHGMHNTLQTAAPTQAYSYAHSGAVVFSTTGHIPNFKANLSTGCCGNMIQPSPNLIVYEEVYSPAQAVAPVHTVVGVPTTEGPAPVVEK